MAWIPQRLKVAYVNKERAAQHEENQLLLRMEQDKEQAITDKARSCYDLCSVVLARLHTGRAERAHK